MKFHFENLEVWQLGMELLDKIYDLVEKYPEVENFNLKQQVISSSTSICLNIADGSGKRSPKEFGHFIRIAICSLLETDANLKIALRRKYLTKHDYSTVDGNIQGLYFKLLRFEKSINRSKHPIKKS